MIQTKDTKVTILSEDDIYLADLYSQLNYGKWIKGKESQFEEKAVNPNMIGILGELAFFNLLAPQDPLSVYLKQRPRFQSDKGDFTLSGEVVVDVKTQVVHKGPDYLISSDTVLANIENKHLQKDYITHFVFITYNPLNNWLYVMGYMSKDDITNYAQLYRKGDKRGNFVYKQDAYSIAYKYLSPVTELLAWA